VKTGDVAWTLIVLAALGVNIGITCCIVKSADKPLDVAKIACKRAPAEDVKLAVKLLTDARLVCRLIAVFRLAVIDEAEERLADNRACPETKLALNVAAVVNAATIEILVVKDAVAVEDADNVHDKLAAGFAPLVPTASEPIALFPIMLSSYPIWIGVGVGCNGIPVYCSPEFAPVGYTTLS
jgi:hypothetical protein